MTNKMTRTTTKIMTELCSNLVILLTILIKLSNNDISILHLFVHTTGIQLLAKKALLTNLQKKRDTIFAFLHESTN